MDPKENKDAVSKEELEQVSKALSQKYLKEPVILLEHELTLKTLISGPTIHLQVLDDPKKKKRKRDKDDEYDFEDDLIDDTELEKGGLVKAKVKPEEYKIFSGDALKLENGCLNSHFSKELVELYSKINLEEPKENREYEIRFISYFGVCYGAKILNEKNFEQLPEKIHKIFEDKDLIEKGKKFYEEKIRQCFEFLKSHYKKETEKVFLPTVEQICEIEFVPKFCLELSFDDLSIKKTANALSSYIFEFFVLKKIEELQNRNTKIKSVGKRSEKFKIVGNIVCFIFGESFVEKFKKFLRNCKGLSDFSSENLGTSEK